MIKGWVEEEKPAKKRKKCLMKKNQNTTSELKSVTHIEISSRIRTGKPLLGQLDSYR